MKNIIKISVIVIFLIIISSVCYSANVVRVSVIPFDVSADFLEELTLTDSIYKELSELDWVELVDRKVSEEASKDIELSINNFRDTDLLKSYYNRTGSNVLVFGNVLINDDDTLSVNAFIFKYNESISESDVYAFVCDKYSLSDDKWRYHFSEKVKLEFMLYKDILKDDDYELKSEAVNLNDLLNSDKSDTNGNFSSDEEGLGSDKNSSSQPEKDISQPSEYKVMLERYSKPKFYLSGGAGIGFLDFGAFVDYNIGFLWSASLNLRFSRFVSIGVGANTGFIELFMKLSSPTLHFEEGVYSELYLKVGSIAGFSPPPFDIGCVSAVGYMIRPNHVFGIYAELEGFFLYHIDTESTFYSLSLRLGISLSF